MESFKEIRLRKGISLAYVARYLNLSTVTVRSKENKKTDFTGPECKALCQLYGVKFEDVLV